MRRRDFINIIGGAAAWPLAARAQQPSNTFRVGIATIQPRMSPVYAPFDQRLRELGYIEGQNLIVDFLNPEDQAEGIAGAIKELVRRKVDVIVAPYESALKSALATTDTVPILMIAIEYDPLALGYIKNLSRPPRERYRPFLTTDRTREETPSNVDGRSSGRPDSDHVLGFMVRASMEGDKQCCGGAWIAGRRRRIARTAL